LAATPVVFGTFAVVSTPALFDVPADPPRVCAEHSAIEFCVHAGHASQLRPLIASVSPLLDAYGTKPATIDHVDDQALFEPSNFSVLDNAVYTELLPNNREGVIDTSGIVARMAGEDACQYDPTMGFTESQMIAADLWSWLMGANPGTPDSGRFSKAPRDEMHRWIADHENQISNCTLTLQDLPR